MLKTLTILLLCLGCLQSYAQDISGKWIGNYEGRDAYAMDMQKLEVDIKLADGTIKGYSYLLYGKGESEKYAIEGTYDKKRATVYFSEERDIHITGGISGHCVPGNYVLTLTMSDSKMRLVGRWEPNISGPTHRLAIKPAIVWLERPVITQTISPAQEKAARVAETKAKPPIDKNLERATDIQETITINKADRNNIRLEFTDNARVDNDIISVYVNGEQKLSKQTISTEALVINFSIPETENEAIVLISAESYGRIAPCTALMKITTTSGKYEVNLSGTFSKNAAVKFIIKE